MYTEVGITQRISERQ